MLKKSLFLILVYLTLSSITHALNAKPPLGTISGTVVDESGHPVELALVNADLLDNRPRGYPVRYVETNKAGHYEIQGLAFGSYKIFAKKEKAGYPDTTFAFYSEHRFATATLTLENPSVVVNMRLGPKAGSLHVNLVDAQTAHALEGTITLRRVAHPEMFITSSTSNPMLIPSFVDVRVAITAPGYQNWPLAEDEGRSIVRLKPEEIRELEIRLVRQETPLPKLP